MGLLKHITSIKCNRCPTNLPMPYSAGIITAEKVHVWVRAPHISVYLLQDLVVLQRATQLQSIVLSAALVSL